MPKIQINELLLATSNKGKVAELARLLHTRRIKIIGLADLADVLDVEETGDTFIDNARIKALAYAQVYGGWVLADDSGLQVDALDLAPGVHSSRYSGYEGSDPKQRDKANLDKLLLKMRDVAMPKRTARFRCCLCLAQSDQVVFETDGTVEGIIAKEPAGENGFGYDPVFYLPERDRTIAQLNHDEKNAISHRGMALKKLLQYLDDVLGRD